jgi:GPI mannosyltransferase 4
MSIMLKILYIFLLICRMLSCTQTGYIHPDEFYQGGQELFFGCYADSGSRLGTSRINFHQSFQSPFGDFDSVNAPWEFHHNNALRSVVIPTVITLFPLWLYTFAKGDCSVGDYNCLSGLEILYGPRVFTALLSIIFIDGSIYYMSKVRKKMGDKSNPWVVLNILASSWLALGFFCRPFSNTIETMCLAVLCAIASHDISHTPSFFDIFIVPTMMGIVGGVGLFSRFTFCIYSFPVVLSVLYSRLQHCLKENRFKLIAISIMTMFLSFTAVAMSFIWFDARFYTNQIGSESSLLLLDDFHKYITPWNAFRYNSQANNLSKHGIHPRVTHLLVNIPLLFGPLAIFFIFRLAFDHRRPVEGMSSVDQMLNAVFFFGLSVLSLAPHQEPRFLLPLIVPLVTLHGHRFANFPRVCYWCIFNAAILCFFGYFHQSGILGSLQYASTLKDSIQMKSIIYYHTYMPPTFLLRNSKSVNTNDNNQACESNFHDAMNSCENLVIIDLAGQNENVLLKVLESELDCSSGTLDHGIVVVGPKPALQSHTFTNSSSSCLFSTKYDCIELWSSFQLSTEDIYLPGPDFFENKLLCVLVRCPLSHSSGTPL